MLSLLSYVPDKAGLTRQVKEAPPTCCSQLCSTPWWQWGDHSSAKCGRSDLPGGPGDSAQMSLGYLQ